MVVLLLRLAQVLELDANEEVHVVLDLFSRVVSFNMVNIFLRVMLACKFLNAFQGLNSLIGQFVVEVLDGTLIFYCSMQCKILSHTCSRAVAVFIYVYMLLVKPFYVTKIKS